MMGECEDNPYMKGLHIKRHDKAVMMLAETIAAASMGQSTIFVDAGRNELPDFIFGKGSSFKQYIQQYQYIVLRSMGQVYSWCT
jgi:hypothetical protein